MDEEKIDNFEEYIEDIPQEVRGFIFGSEMKEVKESLTKYYNNKSDQLTVENNLDLYLLGVIGFEFLVDSIEKLNASEESKTAIKTIIQENVFDELVLLIKAHEELEGVSVHTSDAPSPSDILARLNQNPIKPTVFGKKERDESLLRPVGTPDSALSAKPDAYVDPYREIPEI